MYVNDDIKYLIPKNWLACFHLIHLVVTFANQLGNWADMVAPWICLLKCILKYVSFWVHSKAFSTHPQNVSLSNGYQHDTLQWSLNIWEVGRRGKKKLLFYPSYYRRDRAHTQRSLLIKILCIKMTPPPSNHYNCVLLALKLV